MTTEFINVVRGKVKEGCEQKYLEAVDGWSVPVGMSDRFLIKTGDLSYCTVGLWESEEKLIAARPQMIENLNSVREYLEELSPELGVTDPVSGSVISHQS